MEFKYRQLNNLPALSWYAKISTLENIVEVIHGKAVECHPNFFVAGIWDGDFKNGNFIDTAYCAATGCVKNCKMGGVIFTTPDHLQEAVYLIKERDKLHISNSIPFILTCTNKEFEKNYYNYEDDFSSLIKGMNNYKREIPIKDDILFVFRYCHVEISPKLEISTSSKRRNYSFETYNEYATVITNTLLRLKNNAQSPNRNFHYGLISTISKGYDAAATSAIVKEIGCDEVLTFNKPQYYNNDNGKEIAEKLGYKHIYEGDASKYLENDQLWEAELFSDGDTGSLLVFNSFEELYSNKILFMGIRGDSIWNKNAKEPNCYFDFGKTKCSTEHNTEHFLRTNTILINIPLMFGYNWPKIKEIANSVEMYDYSIGGNYDRPIPRRIIESNGINRNEFGQHKKGAGICYHFDTLKSMKNKMSPYSYQSLMKFKRQLSQNNFLKILKYLKFYINHYPVYLNYFLYKLKLPTITGNIKYSGNPISTLLILWGIDEIKKRYRKALDL